mmetsp:Transcript_5376/g.9321  ORF Transcript_5376/g.9321 Transcript_5376/m.9321 type:complete len:345 (-) Transcript_5376:203-1237(-)
MPRPTMITSDRRTAMAECGVSHFCPSASPPAASLTPGVMCTSHGASAVSCCCAMNPITKSRFTRAIATAASVYDPVARLPAELIWARRRRPRPRGRPTCLRPSMMPGPGMMCAFVMCDHDAMRNGPPWYCMTTVLPMSANLRSSKMRNLCSAARAVSCAATSGVHWSRASAWVLRQHMYGPSSAATVSTSAAVHRSAATHRLLCFAAMISNSILAVALVHSAARSEKLSRCGLSRAGAREAAGEGTGVEAAGGRAVWLSWMKSSVALSMCSCRRPSPCNTWRTSVMVKTEWRARFLDVRCARAPCSRSRSTTTSRTTRPSCSSGSTVSNTLIPLVTRSSTIIHT